MISERLLTIWGLPDISAVNDKTTQHYIAGQFTQARNYIMAMSKEQRKAYLLHVLDLYPTNRDFIEFVLTLI